LTNVRSIVNKFTELQVLVDVHAPHVIGITESWCTGFIADAELHLKGYNLYRYDRIGAPGGGVLLYIHESLSTVICEPLMNIHIDDSVWCMDTLRGVDKLLIGVVYRSPSSSCDNNNRLLTGIRKISDLQDCSHLLLMGDFNIPDIDWQDFTCFNNKSSLTADFLCAIQDSYLIQHISGFTRHSPGQRSSLLDLVFTFNPNSIDNVQHCWPMGSSDHDCIIFKFNCYTTCTDHKEVPCKLNFWKGNYLAICEEPDKVDWNNVLQNNCIDTNWDLFKNRVLTIANKHIPKVRKKPESNKPPWWSKSLSKVVKEKQNLYLQYKFTLSQVDYAKYTSKRNQVKHMIRSAQAQYDESLIQKLSSNPNALYGYVRDKSKVKSKIGQLERSDGTLTTGDEETVEVLNNFFKSVFTNEDPSVIPSFTTRVSTTLSDICITEAEVYDKLVLFVTGFWKTVPNHTFLFT